MPCSHTRKHTHCLPHAQKHLHAQALDESEAKGISVYNNLEEDPILGTQEANVICMETAHMHTYNLAIIWYLHKNKFCMCLQ